MGILFAGIYDEMTWEFDRLASCMYEYSHLRVVRVTMHAWMDTELTEQNLIHYTHSRPQLH